MKLKATPPKPAADNQDERIAAIISGATAASPVAGPTQSAAPQPAARQVVAVPWKAPHVRQDLMVQVNVRLPEPLALKLKHVSHMTDQQKQDLVAEALAPLLDAKLLEIGYTEEDL
jgi:hypothetical protein